MTVTAAGINGRKNLRRKGVGGKKKIMGREMI